MIKVMIPTPLRNLTNNLGDVEVEATNILEMIIQLEAKYKGIGERLLKGEKTIRPFINIYVNDKDIRFMDKEATKLKDGDTVSVIPAIAGGL